MKKLDFVQPNSPVGEGALELAERELGFGLPREYREFLLENNGGLPSECVFDIPGRGQSSIVFYGVQTGDDYSELVCAYAGYRDRLPDGVLPIGFDPGGNLVCLLVKGEDAGQIFFWDHERDGHPPSIQRMYLLADNFGSFVETLQYEDNEPW